MTISVFRNTPQGGDGRTKGTKAELYASFLRSEGYSPELDKHGNVRFKAEGGTYLIFANETDAEYFYLIFPNFWPINGDRERVHAYQAACHATASAKVAKVYPLGDNVSVSIELLFSEPEQFRPVFQRAMTMVKSAVTLFAEKMRELE